MEIFSFRERERERGKDYNINAERLRGDFSNWGKNQSIISEGKMGR